MITRRLAIPAVASAMSAVALPAAAVSDPFIALLDRHEALQVDPRYNEGEGSEAFSEWEAEGFSVWDELLETKPTTKEGFRRAINFATEWRHGRDPDMSQHVLRCLAEHLAT